MLAWTLLRPILPLFVFLSLVPGILFFSASAGWIVWRNAAVSWRVPLYLQYGDGLPPYAQVVLPSLVAHQRYDISLELQVPNIDNNLVLGNFMAGLILSTRSNKTLTSIRKPAIVVPPHTAFYSRAPSSISVHIPLLKSYASGVSTVVADVEVGRRDHWRSLGSEQGRELSVISASLSGVVVHHGIRGLVTRFPLLAGLVSAGIFMAVSSIVVGLCIVPTMFRRPAQIEDLHLELEEVKEEPTTPTESSELSDTSSQEPILTRRSKDVKLEDIPPIPVPTADPSTVPALRRRRSKLVDPVSSDSDS
uniref:Adipose-regulatory protein n=1 Tax=Mycena chlorophos TaxID=658473 RepID=A0ABQ0KYR7_MYCCL|nr:predicted protein [Mycena chlorophos]